MSERSQNNIKYEALILDIDGTLIDSRESNIYPTKAVKDFLNEVNKKSPVVYCTARSHEQIKVLLKDCLFSTPSIFANGAQIIRPDTGEIINEKILSHKQLFECKKIVDLYGKKLYVLDNGIFSEASDKTIKPISALIIELNEKEWKELSKMLSIVKGITIKKGISLSGEGVDILISASGVTKHEALKQIAQILRIDLKQMIGVGDGHNDREFIDLCGLKIAMGNAVPEILEIADYIVSSVEEDGVTEVIKYI